MIKSSTLVLLLMVALAAFILGFALNSPSQSEPDNQAVLLNAQLLEVTDKNDSDELVSASIGDKLGDLTLVNFWATWCAPCRHEMPMFEAMYQQAQQENKNFVIVGVTIDSVAAAQPMLDSMGISYPIVYAENTGMELMAAMGNPEGLLPYSLLLDKDGAILGQKLGRVHQAEVQAWLDNSL